MCKTVTTMTARDVLEEVDRLIHKSHNQVDGDLASKNKQSAHDLMYKFIQHLHPTTMTLPAPLKRK